MANEAVPISSITDNRVVTRTVASGATIEKYSLCYLLDPNTASGSYSLTSGAAFAGIAATEKSSTDTSTTLGLYTDGVWDLTEAGGAGITLGQPVVMSGANKIAATTFASCPLGMIVGVAEETFSAGEVGRVRLKGF